MADVPPPPNGLKHELPLLGGMLLGCLGLWWQADALVLDGRVSGYHWPTWLYGAWHYAAGHTGMLDPFRQPLHSAMVGGLGSSLGLLDAALVVAGLSMVAVVLASGLTARMLVGPWAGALAAAAIPLSPVATSGSRWGTAYPLLTGALAVGVAATVWASRRPTVGTILAAGAAAMLATMTDVRGLLLLVLVLPLVAWRAWQGWSGRALMAVLIVGLVLGSRSAPWLGQTRSLTAAEKRGVQTRVVARWVGQAKDTALVEACRPVSREGFLTPAFLTTPCARAVLRDNLRRALPGTMAWPVWLVALAVVGLVDPRRWRGRPQAPLLGLGCLLAGLGTAVWTPLPARYQLVWTAWTGLLVPLALGWRLRDRPRVLIPVSCCLLGLAAIVDASNHARHPVKGIDARWLQPADIAEVVKRVLPDERPVRDCAGTYVEVALLPNHTAAMGPELSMADAPPCLQWIGGTTARGLIVAPGRTLPGAEGAVDLSATVAATAGWQKVESVAGVEIWVRP